MDDGPESEIYSSYVSNPEPTSSMMLLSFVLGNDPDFIIPLDAVLSLFEFTEIDTTSPIGVTIVGVEDISTRAVAGNILHSTWNSSQQQRFKVDWASPLAPEYYARSLNRYSRNFHLERMVQFPYDGERPISIIHGPRLSDSPSLHIRSIFMADAAVVCVPLIVEETPEGTTKPYESDFRQLLLRCFAAGIRWIVVAVTCMDSSRFDLPTYHRYINTALAPVLNKCGFPKYRVTFVPAVWEDGDLHNVVQPYRVFTTKEGPTYPTVMEAVTKIRRQRHPCEDKSAVFRLQVSHVQRIGGIGTVVEGRVVSGAGTCGGIECSRVHPMLDTTKVSISRRWKTSVGHALASKIVPTPANSKIGSFEIFHYQKDSIVSGDYVGIHVHNRRIGEIPRGCVVTRESIESLNQYSMRYCVVKLVNVSRAPLKPRSQYVFHCGTANATCKIHHVVDGDGKNVFHTNTLSIPPKQTCVVMLTFGMHTMPPVEEFTECPRLSRCFLRNGYDVSALGYVVRKIKKSEIPTTYKT
eukprot:PhF_6_TR11676/c0_g1_i3/m.18898/K03231/EEF1A; elongation factor 1-alpha